MLQASQDVQVDDDTWPQQAAYSIVLPLAYKNHASMILLAKILCKDIFQSTWEKLLIISGPVTRADIDMQSSTVHTTDLQPQVEGTFEGSSATTLDSQQPEQQDTSDSLQATDGISGSAESGESDATHATDVCPVPHKDQSNLCISMALLVVVPVAALSFFGNVLQLRRGAKAVGKPSTKPDEDNSPVSSLKCKASNQLTGCSKPTRSVKSGTSHGCVVTPHLKHWCDMDGPWHDSSAKFSMGHQDEIARDSNTIVLDKDVSTMRWERTGVRLARLE